MEKQRLLKIVNILLAIAFLMTATGGVVRFFAPDVIPYELFRSVHPIFGLTLVLLAGIHIFLNFNWIKSAYFHKPR